MSVNEIAVVMSTYNGEKYVEEQILSIFNQNGLNGRHLQLFVRDDNSSDDTLNILKRLANDYDITIIASEGKNIGVKRSFFEVLKFTSEFDVVFFSDQDDVWGESKVNKFVAEFEKSKYDNKPVAIYSDGFISDKQANPIGETLSGFFRWKNEIPDYKYLLFGYKVTGATFALNRTAVKLSLNIPNEWVDSINMHDSFIEQLIAVEGESILIPEPLIYYRQHEMNVLGAKKVKRDVLSKIANSWRLLNQIYDDVVKLSSLFTGELTEKERYYSEFAQGINGNIFQKIKVIRNISADIWWNNSFFVKLSILFYKG